MKNIGLSGLKLNQKKTFYLAIKYHKKNNLKIALKLYKKILKVNPHHFISIFYLGTLYAQIKKLDLAKSLFYQALKIKTNSGEVHYNLGIVLHELGEHQKAIKSYQKAIRINPNDAAAYNNLGNNFKETKEYKKAISFYYKAIKIEPNSGDMHYNLGIVFHELGKHQKAIKSYQKAIRINPNDAIAYNNLGAVFNELGKNQKAITCFKKSIKIKLINPNAYNGISVVYQILGKYRKSINYSKKALTLKPNSILAQRLIANVHIFQLKNFKKAIKESYKAVKIHHKLSNFRDQRVLVSRLKHDVEQAKYLLSNNYKINGIYKFIKIAKKILKRKENVINDNNFNKKILLKQEEVKSLLPFYKENYIYKTSKILKSCINTENNWREIEHKYFNDSKQILYIDNFLSEEAIKELREFCLVSKVWNREQKKGYLGANADRGFISQIHLQIATDLKKKLPKIFGKHRLQTFWGYKYESNISKGITVHADSALVNLNFWITPNKYNNNKNTGGIKVYDILAPKDWPFAKYNRNTEDIYKFLKDKKANCVDIPYRYNRAVLFNSAYFHQTQEIDFKDEYEGRRINITYLFGNRGFYVPV